MPYKFTPEHSILSSIKKELNPVKELASSAEKLAKSAEERSQTSERLASSSEIIATSSEVQAKAAETLSSLAIEKARKADIKGWIAIAISVIGLMIEIITNFSEISRFISALL